jgi:phosphate acetyltransferase
MDLYKTLNSKAKKKQKTIILPESYDKRVLDAVKFILKNKLAKIILIRAGNKIPISEHKYLDIIDIGFAEQFIDEYLHIRKKKTHGFTQSDAKRALNDPMTFACILLRNNFADAVVAGAVYESSQVIRNAIQIIGLQKNNKTASSFFLFTFPAGHKHKGRILAYADSGVIPNPDSGQLSDIAIQTSANYKKLTGVTPRTAFLSFSTKGSAKDESIEKIIKAYRLTKKREPNLICDGELQFDAAFVPHVAERKNQQGTIKGDANVFIFPDLNSANIAYKITERIGGAIATGPIVQGLAKPVMDLSRGCTARDIINMISIASNI